MWFQGERPRSWYLVSSQDWEQCGLDHSAKGASGRLGKVAIVLVRSDATWHWPHGLLFVEALDSDFPRTALCFLSFCWDPEKPDLWISQT